MASDAPAVAEIMAKSKHETEIQRAITQYLQYKGWFVYRNLLNIGAHKGIADLTAIKNGRVVWIEVKTPHKRSKQNDDQLQFEADITAHGGEYIVARSVDDVMEL